MVGFSDSQSQREREKQRETDKAREREKNLLYERKTGEGKRALLSSDSGPLVW